MLQDQPTNQPPQTVHVFQSEAVTTKNKNRGEGWRGVLSTVLILIAAPLVALTLTAFVFQSYEVDGPSMETTLQNQDRLIVLKVPRTWARITGNSYIPNRGDIIVFTQHNLQQFGSPSIEKQLIKRVIGLPGDRIVVQNGKITIYNSENPSGFNPDSGSGWADVIETTPGNIDLTVQDSQVFVSGDNRVNSLDSRSFGAIDADAIVGKLVLRVFPLNKAEVF